MALRSPFPADPTLPHNYGDPSDPLSVYLAGANTDPNAIGPGAPPTFADRHPKLAGFLAALGPALSALDFTPQQPTPYKTTGFSNFAGALARGGQAFVRGTQAIDTERSKREAKGVQKVVDRKVAAGGLSSLSPEDLYMLQRYGGKSPTNFLSGAQLGKAQGIQADLGLGASGEQKGRVQGLQTGGAAGAKGAADFINTGNPADLQKTIDEQKLDVERAGNATAAARVAHEYEIGLGNVSNDKERNRLVARQQQVQVNETRAKLLDQYVALGISPEQQAAVGRYFDSVLDGKMPAPEPSLEDLPNAALIKAQAAGAAASARTNTFARILYGELQKKYGDKQIPTEALQGIAYLSQPGLGSLAVNSPDYSARMDRSLRDIDKALGYKEGTIWGRLGEFFQRPSAPEQAAAPAAAGPAPTAAAPSNPLLKEGAALAAKVRAKTATPAEIQRLNEINDQLAAQGR